VVVASNPLGGGGGRSSRAAFAPVGASGAANNLTFIECTDRNRGVTYYANATTGETVWTLPPGGVVTQRMAK
jgi:outer membrane protein assembly factor BamB